ncbi:hypothetical protein K438DRAFT_2025720 [Mycena galopus ATCC 62051]|nr:hypothetical protein K438DRAFT_2025720 [Mycena galopus ATCC 62051]
MSQHALAALAKYSSAIATPNAGDGPRMNSQQDYRPIPVISPSNHDFAESANRSGTRSTPSDRYDEDAENIDPNSSENRQTHHPLLASSQVTNILRDSQAYTVASSFFVQQSLPHHDHARDGAESIAAPVPLSYSARSKEVLSSMISPTQPPGFPKPLPQESYIGENSRQASETTGNLSLNASRGLHYNYSAAPAINASQGPHYDYSAPPAIGASQGLHYHYSAPPTYIRPVSPATMIALTEPLLMAWVHDYPPLRPLPSLSYANAQWR